MIFESLLQATSEGTLVLVLLSSVYVNLNMSHLSEYFFLLHIYFIFTVVLWLKTGRQLRPTQLLTPHQQHEGENRKGKSEKTHELRDKNNLISEAKAVCASKTKYGIHSLLRIDR